MAKRKSRGISARAWFYAQPGFHAPATALPCVIVQTDAQNFRCDTHRMAVDQDDVRTPSRCALGREA